MYLVKVAALLVCYLCQGIAGASIDNEALDYGTEGELRLVALREASEELSIALLSSERLSLEEFLARPRLRALAEHLLRFDLLLIPRFNSVRTRLRLLVLRFLGPFVELFMRECAASEHCEPGGQALLLHVGPRTPLWRGCHRAWRT